MKRAYTLIELLVVLTIMVILIAAALGTAKYVMDRGRCREASRQLNTFLSLAKTRAAATGRPCGVYFQLDPPIGVDATDPASPRQCTQVYLAEVPQAFGGGTLGAHGIVRMEGTALVFVPLVPVIYRDDNRDGIYDDDSNMDGIPDPADLDNDSRVDVESGEKAILDSLIDDGEQILVQFDYKGLYYKFERSGSSLLFTGYSAQNHPVHPMTGIPPTHPGPPQLGNNASPGFGYKLLRSPRRIGRPMAVSGGTCIDFVYSGIGPKDNSLYVSRSAVAVMFLPGGSIESVWADGAAAAPAGAVFLLVGETEKVNQPLAASTHPSGFAMFDIEESNLADPDSLWVTVGRNGTITTSDNLPDEAWTDYTTTGQGDYLQKCRESAINHERAQ